MTTIWSNLRSNKIWYPSVLSPINVVCHVSHVVNGLTYSVHTYIVCKVICIWVNGTLCGHVVGTSNFRYILDHWMGLGIVLSVQQLDTTCIVIQSSVIDVEMQKLTRDQSEESDPF